MTIDLGLASSEATPKTTKVGKKGPLESPQQKSKEALSAFDLVRRLSVFQPPGTPATTAKHGSSSDTPLKPVASASEERGDDDDDFRFASDISASKRTSVMDNDDVAGILKGVGIRGSAEPTTPQFQSTSTLVRRHSMFFINEPEEDDEGDVTEQSAKLAEVAASRFSNFTFAEPREHFDEHSMEELGRAANEFVFDEWLNLGQQSTLADRLDRLKVNEGSVPPEDALLTPPHELLVANRGGDNMQRIDKQILGTGFGELAVRSIAEGRYDPTCVLPSLIEGFWDTIDETTYQDACDIEVEPSPVDDGSPGASVLPAASSNALSISSGELTTPRLLAPPLEIERRRSVRTKSVVTLENFFSTFQKRDSVAQTPQAVAAPSHFNVFPTSVEATNGESAAPQVPQAAAAEEGSVLSHFGSSDLAVSLPIPKFAAPCDASKAPAQHKKKIVDFVTDIQSAVSLTLIKMSEAVAPYTFHDFLSACNMAMDALSEGDPHCEVRLPILDVDQAPLVGAEAVNDFVQSHMIDVAHQLGSTVYAAEWVFRYTIAFINAQTAVDVVDALAREEVLAECIQLVADINEFTSLILALGSKARQYQEFHQLQVWMETQAETLIAPLERRFVILLTKCPFAEQRHVLKKHYKVLEDMASRAVNFLSAFDLQWSSTIPYHAAWKEDYLSRCYLRLHGNVANAWMTASLGFVDPVLQLLVKADDRFSQQQPHGFRKRITMAARVERMVASDHQSFQQVALEVKGVPSSVVGLQLCMGARHLLEECEATHDEKWGFSMCNVAPALQAYTVQSGGDEQQPAARHRKDSSAVTINVPSPASSQGQTSARGFHRVSTVVAMEPVISGQWAAHSEPNSPLTGILSSPLKAA